MEEGRRRGRRGDTVEFLDSLHHGLEEGLRDGLIDKDIVRCDTSLTHIQELTPEEEEKEVRRGGC